MSALAMILAAGMAVPGIGPEKVSGEAEQRLDLRGEWVGTHHTSGRGFEHIVMSNGEMIFDRIGFRLPAPFHIEKQTENRLRIRWAGRPYLGIYEQRDDRVRICLRVAEDGPPQAFGLGGNLVILTFRRVKPTK